MADGAGCNVKTVTNMLMLLMVGACSTEAPPVPPDMSSIVTRYQSPTAFLTQDTVVELVTLAVERVEYITRAESLQPVFSALSALFGEQQTRVLNVTSADDESLSPDGLVSAVLERTDYPVQVGGTSVDGGGYVRVTRICNGWENSDVPDRDANGYIQLTAVIRDSGIHPVIWGEAVSCRYRFQESRVLVDGEVKVHAGSSFDKNPDGPDNRVVVEFHGEVELDGKGLLDGADFAFSSDEFLEVSLSVGPEHLVFFAGTDLQGFRAANGRWTCDFEKAVCRSDSGESLSFSQ